MQDYVQLIKFIKQKYNAQNSAVIVFGGSYGGMLAAWLRMKYPATFQGALAASAPILQFRGNSAAETEFSDIITDDFAQTYPDERCSKGIKQGFTILENLKTRQTDWPELSAYMPTCDNIKSAQDITNLQSHYENGFAYMAMTNYPTPNSFLNPMPAWPVNASCLVYKDIAPTAELVNDEPSNGLSNQERTYLKALNDAANIYFNYTGQIKCVNTSDTEATGTLAASGWDVLACNQLPMPVSDSDSSMFIKKSFDYAQYTADCQKNYGLTPDYDWAFRTFGGGSPSKDFYEMTNIIFSNGLFDPWRSGGVTDYINLNLPTYVIKNGAHHLDLREPTPEDAGTDVEWVRKQEASMIEQWIIQYQKSSSSTVTMVQK